MRQPTPLTDKFLEDLRLKLKDLRIKKNHFAKLLGTSPQVINTYFHNVRKPTGEMVLRMIELIKKGFSIFL